MSGGKIRIPVDVLSILSLKLDLDQLILHQVLQVLMILDELVSEVLELFHFLRCHAAVNICDREAHLDQ